MSHNFKFEVKVDFLKRLLDIEKLPLLFNWDDFEVLVMPKPTDSPYEHDIYVDGLHYRHLYATGKAKEWYSSARAESQEGKDFRYLLGLDKPGPSKAPHEKLGSLFTGIRANSKEQAAEYKELLRSRHGTHPAENISIIVQNPASFDTFVLFSDGTKVAV